MIDRLGHIYKIEGFYRFSGNDNHFTGQFSINQFGFISGKIWDPNSICSEHKVAGKVEQKENSNELVLEFVKMPTGLLTDAYYYLKKSSAPINKVAGSYEGSWSFQEEVIPIVKGTEGETKNQTHIYLEWLLPLNQ